MMCFLGAGCVWGLGNSSLLVCVFGSGWVLEGMIGSMLFCNEEVGDVLSKHVISIFFMFCEVLVIKFKF